MQIKSTSILEIVRKIGLTAFGLALLYGAYSLAKFHYRLIIYPFPEEYREGAILFTTQLMLRGINPFQFDQMPLAANVYGIVYHLAAYPLASLLGPTFLVHRALTGLSLVLCCLLLLVVLLRDRVPLLHGLSLALIFYAVLLFYTTPLARPDGLGTLLFLASAYIPHLRNYSRKALLLSGALGVLAFFTKAYFGVSIAYVAGFTFLFVSKKRGLAYAMYSFVLLGASSLLVNRLAPAYFLNTIWSHVNVAGRDYGYLMDQLREFARVNVGIILLALIVPGYRIARALRLRSAEPAAAGKPEILRSAPWRDALRLGEFDAPLLGLPASFSLYCFLLSLALVFFSLGRHEGNWMVYLYQLMSPFLLVFVGDQLAELEAGNGLASRYGFLPVMLLILWSLWLAGSSLPAPAGENDTTAWIKMNQLLAAHHNILNSPAVAGLLVAQGKPLYDSGQSEYFSDAHYPEGFLDGFFPPNALIAGRWTDYQASLNARIQSRAFDLVAVTHNRVRFVSAELLQQYYQFDRWTLLCMPQTDECWRVDIWVPPGG